MDLKLLKRRTGALKVSARDSVTGAPIPYAQVYEGSSCVNFCLQTGRDGDVTRTGIELGNRNAAVTKSLTAKALGYWPQVKSVTIKAGETPELLYQLQPECEPAKVVGTVVNAETQAPIHKASITGGLDHAVQTDVNGRFEIDGIKPSLGNNPRDVTLTASAAGFYSESKTIKIFCGARITVDFGSRTSQAGTIIGTVTDDDTDQPMKDVFVGTSFGGTAKTDVNGNYTIENAPLGDLDAPREWTVIAQPAGRKASVKTVVVEAGKQSRRDFLFSSANERPAATPKAIALDEDADHEFTVSGTDPDGDSLTHHVMRFPEHGVLIGRAPNLTYRPDDDYHGPDSFEFLVNDGAASSERAQVDITVRPVNDPPSGRDDHLDVQPDATTRIPAATLLANDIDADHEPLEITAVRATKDGTKVALDGDEVVLTPPPGYTNTQEVVLFDYTLEDGAGKQSSAMVYVRVDHGPAAPRCVDARFEVLQGGTLDDALSCTDVNGDALTYQLIAAPAHGTLQLDEDGTFSFAAPAGFLGETTFTFRATDGERESAVATATVAVVRENAAPACADKATQTDEDTAVTIELGCTDADGDGLEHELLGGPAHGTLEKLSEGRYRYAPAADWSGEDAFTFRASDGDAASGTATARITVAAVNDAPACKAVTLATGHGAAAEVAPDCSDVDGDQLSYEIAAQGAKGSASVAAGKLRFAAAAGASGADAFTYRARDGKAASAPARVDVTIAAAPPVDPEPTPDPTPQPTPEPTPEPTPTPQPEQDVKGEQQSGSELLLGCTDRAVVLEDVVPEGRRVRLLGVAERAHAGERAEIRFLATGKVVARPVVGPDGRFAATAPLPKGKLRHSNKARYAATVAGERSPALKLERRMQVTQVRAASGKVTIAGRVLGPLAKRAADRAIEVQRRRSCSSTEVVARVKPAKDGRFRVTLDAPEGQRAAVYRLRAKVRRSAASARLFDTFTLPRAVDF
jgi:hypothetical protein